MSKPCLGQIYRFELPLWLPEYSFNLPIYTIVKQRFNSVYLKIGVFPYKSSENQMQMHATKNVANLNCFIYCSTKFVWHWMPNAVSSSILESYIHNKSTNIVKCKLWHCTWNIQFRLVSSDILLLSLGQTKTQIKRMPTDL